MIFISYMLSLYINNNTEKTLLKEAAKIVQYFPYREDLKKDFDFFNPKRVFDIEISIENSENQIPIRRLFRDNNYYLKVTYPYTNSNKVIILTKNISNEKDILINIYLIMLIVTIVGFLFIIYYASKLSKEIMQPLYTITNKFDNMNESLLAIRSTPQRTRRRRALGSTGVAVGLGRCPD
ncbi:MAG TPA: hypothetical protein ENK99_01035 [Campylobacterales bacterium]|nr:hypothetical protein [Campylobacterales bacterium]